MFPVIRTYVNSVVKDVKDQNLRYRLQADFIITRRGGSGQVSAAPFTPLNLIMGTSVSRTLPVLHLYTLCYNITVVSRQYRNLPDDINCKFACSDNNVSSITTSQINKVKIIV